MSLFLIIVLLVVGWILYSKYLQQMLAQGKAGKFKIVLIALGLIFLAMALTGRAPALFAILGAAMTQIMRLAPLLIRFAPFLKRYLGGGAAAAAGAAYGASSKASRVTTDTLVMSLDHTSGSIGGKVIAGQFEGRTLDSLSLAELQSLYGWCESNDPDAARLLHTYIQRERVKDWQSDGSGQQAGGNGSAGSGSSQRGAGGRGVSNGMTITEARQVLGLEGTLTREDIASAHRSLMGRFHPDKGGNDYLASKINTARKVLLDTLDAG